MLALERFLLISSIEKDLSGKIFDSIFFQTVLALGSSYLSCIEGDLYARIFDSFLFTCLDLRKLALNIKICDSFLVTCVDLPRLA